MSRLTKILLAAGLAIVVVAAFAVGAWYVFVRSDAAPRAALRQNRCTQGGPIEGTYSLAAGDLDSFVGYRVQEQFGFAVVESTATGRTSDVTGSFTIKGSKVEQARFTADLRTLTSEHENRDKAIRSVGLESNTFPRARFVLTHPIDLSSATTATNVKTAAVGDFTLHGVTRRVEIALEACRGKVDADQVQVIGHLPIAFADYDIETPSVAGFVSVRDQGEMEFQLFLEKR